MGLRESYKDVIKHQLEILEENEGLSLTDYQKDKLVEKLHESTFFHEELTEMLAEHLDVFGENYDI